MAIINNGRLEAAFKATVEEDDKGEVSASVPATTWSSLVAALVPLIIECLHTDWLQAGIWKCH